MARGIADDCSMRRRATAEIFLRCLIVGFVARRIAVVGAYADTPRDV